MSTVLGGIGLIALGMAGIALWIGSRRRQSVYRRHLEGLRSFLSAEYARGMVGGSVLISVGLVVQGLAILLGTLKFQGATVLSPAVAVGLMGLAVALVVLGFVVSKLHRPKWLYPAFDR